MHRTKQKQTGAHFTPSGLAAVVAERLVGMIAPHAASIRILDPACGDGNLLVAMASVLSRRMLSKCTLLGIEADRDSFAAACHRLRRFNGCATDLIQGNFLDLIGDESLFQPTPSLPLVDAIIANPPYVRTQVLGAARSQDLAARFRLSGRVDLYQAFLVAMARQLRAGGVLGVITSNRFLSTMAGASTRAFLRSHFDIQEVIDLGDTKLFDAAVLPALIFAVRRSTPQSSGNVPACRFVRIYEDVESDRSRLPMKRSVLELVRKPAMGSYVVDRAAYHVGVGSMDLPQEETVPWTMLTATEKAWVDRVRRAAVSRIGDVARIRVGIKTTADNVYIRRDWSTMPREQRPERHHLRHVVSHEEAARWIAEPSQRGPKHVLYTHTVVSGKRRAIAFDDDSPTWKYLLAHRQQLESRAYVIEAGREWYEIWVPQDPEAWTAPKIVFPDISPEQRFFLDEQGSVVDGNCYWITTNEDEDQRLLLLILGVANSAVMSRYHTLLFQNKLYSQRRRFLTQYVSQYPLPDPWSPESNRIVSLVRKLVRDDRVGERTGLEAELDEFVAKAFDVEWPCATNGAD